MGGDFGILWEKDWFCCYGKEYPLQWELQREICLWKRIWFVMGNYVDTLSRFLFQWFALSNFLSFTVHMGICFILPLCDKQMSWKLGICENVYWVICFVQILELLCIHMKIYFILPLWETISWKLGAYFVTNGIATKMTSGFIKNEIKVYQSFMTHSLHLIG